MNSFKKIALGLVAAMTLGTIVATPASANTLTLTVSTAVSGSGTAAAPYVVKVPFDNVVSDTAVATSEVLTLALSNLTINVPVTVTGVGNVRFLTATGGATTAGVSSLTFTPLAATATIFAYTTSTSASAITVSVLGTSQTIYLKGDAGPAYFLTGTVPSTGHVGGKVTATLNVTDIFGNPTTATINATAINATVPATATADVLVVGRYSVDVTLPAVSGTSAVNFALAANPVDVPTLAVESTSVTAIVTATDLAAALAAMTAAKNAADKALADEKAASTKALADAKAASDAALLAKDAEIAKLKADAVAAKLAADKAASDAKAAADKALADARAEAVAAKAASDLAIADLKAAFNKLARQWNKKNPKSRVALVK